MYTVNASPGQTPSTYAIFQTDAPGQRGKPHGSVRETGSSSSAFLAVPALSPFDFMGQSGQGPVKGTA